MHPPSLQFILLRNIAMARFLTPDERCWLLQRQQRALRKKLERNQRANKAHAAFVEWRVYYLSAAWYVVVLVVTCTCVESTHCIMHHAQVSDGQLYGCAGFLGPSNHPQLPQGDL